MHDGNVVAEDKAGLIQPRHKRRTNDPMFNNDIILNPTSFGGANVNQTYSLVLPLGTDTSLRRVSATATTTPEVLRISHQTIQRKNSVGVVQYGSHLIKLSEVFIDPLLGLGEASVRLVIDDPIGTSVWTAQKRLNLIGRLLAFEQTSGNLDKILNNEP